MADYIVLEGSVKWAKVFEDNRDMTNFDGTPSDCDGKYTIDVGLSKESEALILSHKSKVKQKNERIEAPDGSVSFEPAFDDNGRPVYKFNRKHEGPWAEAGGPPKVYHSDGKAWDFVTDGSIGNGSEAKVKICLYPSKYGKYARLESIVVTNYVSFDDSPKNWDEEMFTSEADDKVPF